MKKLYKYLLVIIWMMVIFMLSNEASGVSSGRSDLVVHAVFSSFNLDFSRQFMTFLVRKSAHIIAYLILGILLFNVIKDFRLNTGRTILMSVLFAFLYAVSDEFHQLFVAGRSCELRDIMIDTAAATVGVACFKLVTLLIQKKDG